MIDSDSLIIPNDIFCLVCKFIDNNASFVNFTTTCKYFVRFMQARPLTDTYLLSKILPACHNYVFTKIIYDLNKLSIGSIPKLVKSITFNDDFNDDITELYSLPKLEFIGIGTNFANMESIKFVPATIINKKDLILTTIANILSLGEHKYVIDGIIYYNEKLIYKIKTKINKKMLNFIKNNSFDAKSVNQLKKIIFNRVNQSISDFLAYVDIFDKYKYIMAKRKPDISFLKNNHCSIKEFIEITQTIYDKKQIFLDHIYQKILDKYQCSTISEFSELCSRSYNHDLS